MKGVAKANVWCILRECDWEEVARVTEDFAINNLLEEKFRKYAEREQKTLRGFMPLDKGLTQDVCLRCCTVQDNIQEYLSNCRAIGYRGMKRERQKVQRQEKVKVMLENCAKNKFRKIFNGKE